MDNKHYDLSDYPTDQQAVGGRVEPVVMCGCKRCDGARFIVRITNERNNDDHGKFDYCEKAIAIDVENGLTVDILQ